MAPCCAEMCCQAARHLPAPSVTAARRRQPNIHHWQGGSNNNVSLLGLHITSDAAMLLQRVLRLHSSTVGYTAWCAHLHCICCTAHACRCAQHLQEEVGVLWFQPSHNLQQPSQLCMGGFADTTLGCGTTHAADASRRRSAGQHMQSLTDAASKHQCWQHMQTLLVQQHMQTAV